MKENFDYELIFDDEGQVEVDYDEQIVRYTNNKNVFKEYILSATAATRLQTHQFLMNCLIRKGQMERVTV
jgi:hypothetical protein